MNQTEENDQRSCRASRERGELPKKREIGCRKGEPAKRSQGLERRCDRTETKGTNPTKKRVSKGITKGAASARTKGSGGGSSVKGTKIG